MPKSIEFVMTSQTLTLRSSNEEAVETSESESEKE